jgi:hypothetical protein
MKPKSLVPAPASSAALVAMPEPGESLDRAGRVNFFHRLSREAGVVSIRAALAAGVELLQAKEELAGGFVEWVKRKCAFGTSTAYNYMNLVQRSLPEASLPKLLAGSDADREREIEEVASSTDSRTLTELYDDLGIVRKTQSNMGGARPGAGRKPKHALSNDEIAAQAAALQTDPELAAREFFDLMDKLVAWVNGPAGFAALPDARLNAAVAKCHWLDMQATHALRDRKAAAGKGAAK